MELTSEFEAGAILRGPIVRQLERIAWWHRVHLDMNEDKRLLHSHYLFRVSGDTEAVNGFWRDWERYMRELDHAEQK